MDPDEQQDQEPSPPAEPLAQPALSRGAPEKHQAPQAAEAAPAPRAKSRGPSKRVRLAALVLAALVLGGGMAALVLNVAIDRIRAGPPGPPTRTVVVPTLPPEWTPTPSPLTAASRTPAPILQETARPGLQADLPTVALQQMRGQNYEGAVETWAQVIQQDPGNPQAYYGRAYSYLRLTRGLGMHTVFVQYSQAALADAERAIALSPEPNGDYFLARSWAIENLALATYLRVDRDRLNEVALENMRVGISLPHSEPLVIYAPVELLLRLGRCDEALQEVDRLELERGTGLAPSPQLTYYRGVGLLCMGKYQQALDAFIVARNAYGECEYDYQQAVALYFLGRPDEALRKLAPILTGCPTYDGYRYYLRALIRYERGDTEGASEDLLQGSFTTWDWRGLKAYVEARLLADEGQRQEAMERMQQAELTFERTRGPFLDRIRRELAALGGRPIAATPQPLPEATPIPPLPPDHPTPPPVVRALHNGGTGALQIAPGGTLMLHFRGPSGFTFTKARTLEVYLVSAETSGGPVLEMQLFDPLKQWWEDFDPRWGQNTIVAPDRFFYGSGDLFIRLHNPGQNSVAIYDVGLDLSVVDGYGEHVTWSFLES